MSKSIKPNNIRYKHFGGAFMKMVVVKSPKFLAGLFRIIFRIKKEPLDES